MAYSQKLLDLFTLNDADGYGFTTNAADKRNCNYISISVVFGGPLTGTSGSPDGSLTLQTSNDIEGSGMGGAVWGGIRSQSNPLRGDDWLLYPSSTQSVYAAQGLIYQWNIQSSAHWIRVVYTSIINEVMTVSVYVNGVIQDRG
jgi:hypothetical protein